MRFVGRAADSKSRKQGHFSSRPPSLVHHGGTERHRFRWIRLLGLNGGIASDVTALRHRVPVRYTSRFLIDIFCFSDLGWGLGFACSFRPSFLVDKTNTDTHSTTISVIVGSIESHCYSYSCSTVAAPPGFRFCPVEEQFASIG